MILIFVGWNLEIQRLNNVFFHLGRVKRGWQHHTQFIVIQLVVLKIVQVLAPGSLSKIVTSQINDRVISNFVVDKSDKKFNVRHYTVISLVFGLSLVVLQNWLFKSKTVIVFLLEKEGRLRVAVIRKVDVHFSWINKVERFNQLLFMFFHICFRRFMERWINCSNKIINEIEGDCTEWRSCIIKVDFVLIQREWFLQRKLLNYFL